MRRFIILLVTAAAVVAPASASAQLAPASDPDPHQARPHADGRAVGRRRRACPISAPRTSYNAGDWENTLRACHGTDTGAQRTTQPARQGRRRGRAVAPPRGQAEEQVPLQGQAVRPQRPQRAMSAIKHHGKHHGNGHQPQEGGDRLRRRRDPAVELHRRSTRTTSRSARSRRPRPRTRSATAIKPSLDLFNLAKQKGITIFLITGPAREHPRAHDVHLTRERFAGYKQLILKPDAVRPTARSSTSPPRGRASRIRGTGSSPTSAISTAIWPGPLGSCVQASEPLLLPSVIHVRGRDPAVRSLIAPAGSLPRSRRAHCFCDQLREPVRLVPADERARVRDLDHARVR